jgi:UDP-2,3-diacylglucosamine pyrophosphatase LpxH
MLLVGDRAHGFLLKMNRWFNALRRLQGKPYWSLAAWVKSRIGKARTFIRRFELAALTAAEKGHYDGFICGHIHSAGFLRSDDGLYCNDGDWVEHCTALVESADGRLSLLHWSERPEIQAVEPEAPAPDVRPGQRPVIDVLPASFIEQVNRLAR